MSRVISVVSLSHSGSTLLDCLIGSIPGVFSTGEVMYLPWQLYRRGEEPPTVTKEQALASQDVCTCLKSFRECQVWRDVIERLSDKVGFNIYDDPLRFKMAILEHDRHWSCRPATPWKDLFLIRLPRIATIVGSRRRGMKIIADVVRTCLRRQVRNNWLLFDTICEASGARYVVDSTKDVVRAMMLHSFRPSSMRAIFLVRDVHGVVFSLIRRNSESDPIRIAEGWVRGNNRLVSVLDGIKGLDYVVVSYESLTRDPVSQRRRIAGFLGLPDPGDDIRITTTDSHLVAGNPMRYRGDINIRYDDAWKRELDPGLCRELDRIAKGLAKALRDRLDGLNRQ